MYPSVIEIPETDRNHKIVPEWEEELRLSDNEESSMVSL
jgi:hypothetical protein